MGAKVQGHPAQEISHMKVAVKGRAPVSMDALVQQTESPFITGVLHLGVSNELGWVKRLRVKRVTGEKHVNQYTTRLING